MIVEFKPWLNPLRPWRVESTEFYKLCHTSPGPNRAPPFWHIKLGGRQQWLENLKPVRIICFEYPAVTYRVWTERLAVMPYGDGRMVLPMPRPPAMWFARKSDVLLLKLTWGGSD